MEDIISCGDCGQSLGQSDTFCPKCKSKNRHIQVFFEDTIGVHDQIKGKQKRPGKKKPIREFKSGDDFHRDSGEWRYLEMDVNRETKEYEKTIIDKSTGEVIHHCKEPLGDHRGHGSAKWNHRLMRRKAWLPPLFAHIKPGTIVEFGCGNGFVIEDLSREFPDCSIIGIDMDQKRLDSLNGKNLSNVETMNADITTKIVPNKSADTILYVGVLHEVFSLSGRDKVLDTLKLGHEALKDDGILIIQDFLKPAPQQVTLTFKNKGIHNRFLRYAQEYQPWTVKYEEIDNGVILDIADAVEFLTKYRPPNEERWKHEMGESHHYFTMEEFIEVAGEAGFKIKESIKLLNGQDYFEEIRADLEFDFDESERAWIQFVMEKVS